LTVKKDNKKASLKIDRTIVIRDENDLAYFYSRLDEDRNFQIFKNLASESYANLFKN
jgi:hypothetical protein